MRSSASASPCGDSHSSAARASAASSLGVILPKLMMGSDTVGLREASRRLLLVGRYAHEYAVTHHCEVQLALDLEKVREAIAGKEVHKVIFVPGRLINIVAR